MSRTPLRVRRGRRTYYAHSSASNLRVHFEGDGDENPVAPSTNGDRTKSVNIILDGYGFPNGKKREEILAKLPQENIDYFITEAYKLANQLSIAGTRESTPSGYRTFFLELLDYLSSSHSNSSRVSTFPGKQPKLLTSLVVSKGESFVPFGDLEHLIDEIGKKELASKTGHDILIKRGYTSRTHEGITYYYRT